MEKSEKFLKFKSDSENNKIDDKIELHNENGIRFLKTYNYNSNNNNNNKNKNFSLNSGDKEEEFECPLYRSRSLAEDIFKIQKEKIKKLKEKNKSKKNIQDSNNSNKSERNNTKENITINFSKIIQTNSSNYYSLSISNPHLFEQTIFNYNPKIDKDYIPLLNNSWEECNQLFKTYKKNNFIELSKKSLRTITVYRL